MSWNRLQHHKKIKQPRHARVSLCLSHCPDCKRELQMTYVLSRFEGRCRSCWSTFVNGAKEMASHYQEGEQGQGVQQETMG